MMKIYLTTFLILAAQIRTNKIATGYYNSTKTKSGTKLQVILHNLIGRHKAIRYAAIWTALYLTYGYINERKINYSLVKTITPTWKSTNSSKLGTCNHPRYSKTIFKPIDKYKGDLTLTYFYITTQYYGDDADWPANDMVNSSQPKT